MALISHYHRRHEFDKLWDRRRATCRYSCSPCLFSDLLSLGIIDTKGLQQNVFIPYVTLETAIVILFWKSNENIKQIGAYCVYIWDVWTFSQTLRNVRPSIFPFPFMAPKDLKYLYLVDKMHHWYTCIYKEILWWLFFLFCCQRFAMATLLLRSAVVKLKILIKFQNKYPWTSNEVFT